MTQRNKRVTRAYSQALSGFFLIKQYQTHVYSHDLIAKRKKDINLNLNKYQAKKKWRISKIV